MKQYKAALLDMDGTLFDTKKGVIGALKEAIRDYGLKELEPEEEDQFIGPPIQKTIECFYGISEAEAIEAADVFRKYYREKDYVIVCDLYDGMRETLESLRAEGVKLCVASLKKEDMVKRICKHYGVEDLFDSIHGTDARDNLSKSDIIKICLDEVGVDLDDAVMIGDTVFDAMGAEKAGCKFLGVTYGYGFRTESDVAEYANIGTAKSADEIADFFC
ncbi:MAG: HAD hydrolase-like protein [Lachnospiraceae bacterium]|nr:HAD hydrolase-like protein [Lachnospiraceae bacterium]